MNHNVSFYFISYLEHAKIRFEFKESFDLFMKIIVELRKKERKIKS